MQCFWGFKCGVCSTEKARLDSPIHNKAPVTEAPFGHFQRVASSFSQPRDDIVEPLDLSGEPNGAKVTISGNVTVPARFPHHFQRLASSVVIARRGLSEFSCVHLSACLSVGHGW